MNPSKVTIKDPSIKYDDDEDDDLEDGEIEDDDDDDENENVNKIDNKQQRKTDNDCKDNTTSNSSSTNTTTGNNTTTTQSDNIKSSTTGTNNNSDDDDDNRHNTLSKRDNIRSNKRSKLDQTDDHVSTFNMPPHNIDDEYEMLCIRGGSPPPQNYPQFQQTSTPSSTKNYQASTPSSTQNYQQFTQTLTPGSTQNYQQSTPSSTLSHQQRHNNNDDDSYDDSYTADSYDDSFDDRSNKKRRRRRRHDRFRVERDGNKKNSNKKRGRGDDDSDLEIPRHENRKNRKMELCKFYIMECCAKRDKCLYMHSEFPCKFYYLGLPCPFKETCKYLHGKPLSDNLREILLKHLETAPKEILGEFPRLPRDFAIKLITFKANDINMENRCNKDSLSASQFDLSPAVYNQYLSLLKKSTSSSSQSTTTTITGDSSGGVFGVTPLTSSSSATAAKAQETSDDFEITPEYILSIRNEIERNKRRRTTTTITGDSSGGGGGGVVGVAPLTSSSSATAAIAQETNDDFEMTPEYILSVGKEFLRNQQKKRRRTTRWCSSTITPPPPTSTITSHTQSTDPSTAIPSLLSLQKLKSVKTNQKAPNYLNLKNLTGILTQEQIDILEYSGIETIEDLNQLTVAQLNDYGITVNQINDIQLNSKNIQKLGLLSKTPQSSIQPQEKIIKSPFFDDVLLYFGKNLDAGTKLTNTAVQDVDMRLLPPLTTVNSNQLKSSQTISSPDSNVILPFNNKKITEELMNANVEYALRGIEDPNFDNDNESDDIDDDDDDQKLFIKNDEYDTENDDDDNDGDNDNDGDKKVKLSDVDSELYKLNEQNIRNAENDSDGGDSDASTVFNDQNNPDDRKKSCSNDVDIDSKLDKLNEQNIRDAENDTDDESDLTNNKSFDVDLDYKANKIIDELTRDMDNGTLFPSYITPSLLPAVIEKDSLLTSKLGSLSKIDLSKSVEQMFKKEKLQQPQSSSSSSSSTITSTQSQSSSLLQPPIITAETAAATSSSTASLPSTSSFVEREGDPRVPKKITRTIKNDYYKQIQLLTAPQINNESTVEYFDQLDNTHGGVHLKKDSYRVTMYDINPDDFVDYHDDDYKQNNDVSKKVDQDMRLPSYFHKESNNDERGIPHHQIAKEIDASLESHGPIKYKLDEVFIPRPHYPDILGLAIKPELSIDPRIRRIFGIRDNDQESLVDKKTNQQSHHINKQQEETLLQPNMTASKRCDPRLVKNHKDRDDLIQPPTKRHDPRRRNEQPDALPISTGTNILPTKIDIHIIQQKSEWYNKLGSNNKIQVNEHIAELISVLKRYHLSKLNDNGQLFDVEQFKSDNEVIFQTLLYLGVMVDEHGQFYFLNESEQLRYLGALNGVDEGQTHNMQYYYDMTGVGVIGGGGGRLQTIGGGSGSGNYFPQQLQFQHQPHCIRNNNNSTNPPHQYQHDPISIRNNNSTNRPGLLGNAPMQQQQQQPPSLLNLPQSQYNDYRGGGGGGDRSGNDRGGVRGGNDRSGGDRNGDRSGNNQRQQNNNNNDGPRRNYNNNNNNNSNRGNNNNNRHNDRWLKMTSRSGGGGGGGGGGGRDGRDGREGSSSSSSKRTYITWNP